MYLMKLRSSRFLGLHVLYAAEFPRGYDAMGSLAAG